MGEHDKMSFGLKPHRPVADFGDHAGKSVEEWPDDYLHRMYGLALDGRIMDRSLANHIIDVYQQREKEHDGK